MLRPYGGRPPRCSLVCGVVWVVTWAPVCPWDGVASFPGTDDIRVVTAELLTRSAMANKSALRLIGALSGANSAMGRGGLGRFIPADEVACGCDAGRIRPVSDGRPLTFRG